jgi:hypothetical protein
MTPVFEAASMPFLRQPMGEDWAVRANDVMETAGATTFDEPILRVE